MTNRELCYVGLEADASSETVQLRVMGLAITTYYRLD